MPHGVGLLGGTFDPVHLGHLNMAEWVMNTLNLSQVYLIPSGQPPHKADRYVSPKEQRLAMVQLAVQDNPRLGVLTLEIEKNAPSLTIETLQALDGQFNRRPHFIIGLDSLLTLHTWECYRDFPNYCRLAVVRRYHETLRTGDDIYAWADQHLPALADCIDWVDMPLLEISSTRIRACLKQGFSCQYLLQMQVWDYIQSQHLYQ